MDKEQVTSILEDYKESLINAGTGELEERTLGFINGLEYAISLYDKRPAIYITKDRTYSDYDKKKFPEFFL